MTTARIRTEQFCQRFGLGVPILMAPMAGSCPPSLAIAVANAGGLGACGVLHMQATDIAAWVAQFRGQAQGAFQLNVWVPDPSPVRDAQHEAQVRDFLSNWGPAVSSEAGNVTLMDFAAQCEAMLAVNPPIVSSIMGLYPPDFVKQLKARGIAWFATVTTVAEARAAQAAGADVLVAQGMEAGGHRGCFEAGQAQARQVGLFSLLPAVVDAVKIPVVATGGIGDARGVAAALTLGASAVQIGTALLRSPEAKIDPAWASALAKAAPEDTVVTRAFSGRAGRSVVTDYVRAAEAATAPTPAPYPVQRGLTSGMRKAAQQSGDSQKMQMWAGQSAGLASSEPAADIVRSLWNGAQQLLR
ncbi:MAG: nitronate monooxygenase [Paralcaligenes sp.]